MDLQNGGAIERYCCRVRAVLCLVRRYVSQMRDHFARSRVDQRDVLAVVCDEPRRIRGDESNGRRREIREHRGQLVVRNVQQHEHVALPEVESCIRSVQERICDVIETVPDNDRCFPIIAPVDEQHAVIGGDDQMVFVAGEAGNCRATAKGTDTVPDELFSGDCVRDHDVPIGTGGDPRCVSFVG